MTDDEGRNGGAEAGSAFTDIHYHFVPPEVRRFAEAGAPGNPAWRIFKGLLDAFPDLGRPLADRELATASGRAVVSLPTALGPGIAGIGSSAELIRASNDALIAAVADEDAYESAMIILPWDDPQAALAELDRVGDDPAVSDVIFHVGLQQARLADEPDLEPVYREIAARGLPLFLHPLQETPLPALARWFLFSTIGAPTATSIAAAQLMLSGMLDRVPDLTLIIPHLGGTLPFLAQRIVDQSGTGDAQHDVLHYLRTRTYLDTCSFHPPALECALDTVGADRILLGSDFPFRGPVRRASDEVESELAVDGAERVLTGNLTRLRDASGLVRQR